MLCINQVLKNWIFFCAEIFVVEMKNFTRWGEIFGTWVANAEYTYHIPILGDITVKAVS